MSTTNDNQFASLVAELRTTLKVAERYGFKATCGKPLEHFTITRALNKLDTLVTSMCDLALEGCGNYGSYETLHCSAHCRAANWDCVQGFDHSKPNKPCTYCKGDGCSQCKPKDMVDKEWKSSQ